MSSQLQRGSYKQIFDDGALADVRKEGLDVASELYAKLVIIQVALPSLFDSLLNQQHTTGLWGYHFTFIMGYLPGFCDTIGLPPHLCNALRGLASMRYFCLLRLLLDGAKKDNLHFDGWAVFIANIAFLRWVTSDQVSAHRDLREPGKNERMDHLNNYLLHYTKKFALWKHPAVDRAQELSALNALCSVSKTDSHDSTKTSEDIITREYLLGLLAKLLGFSDKGKVNILNFASSLQGPDLGKLVVQSFAAIMRRRQDYREFLEPSNT